MLPIKLKIPDNFFNEEVRCGYNISRQMKEIWAVELDLLDQFIRVCEEYKLKYFVMGGTLLGTIRHKGFIPWDDDIDVIMPRNDYNKLLQIGPKVFQHPYFFSTPETEHKFWRSHIQIRNSETTGSIQSDENRNNNKGIFIDVFVLDDVPNDSVKRAVHRKKISKIYRWVSIDMDLEYRKKNLKSIKYIILKIITKLFVNAGSYSKTFQKFNKACALYSGNESHTVAHTALSYREAVVWDKNDFTDSQIMPFEMLNVTVPAGYKSVLTKHYGENYMEIPKEYPKTAHGEVFFDVNKPFTFYYK